MKFDTNTKRELFGAFFKDHEEMAVEILLNAREPMKTVEVWEKINETGIKISKASVINFLKTLADEGLANYDTRPGKGGYHRRYKLVTRDKAELEMIIVDRFIFKLWEVFPDNPKLIELMQR